MTLPSLPTRFRPTAEGALRALLVPIVGAALVAACAPDTPEGDRADAAPFDVLITNARVVDGMGNPWYRADVGLRGDRIAAIGDLDGRDAGRTIDAADRVLAPGFIDMMGQSSTNLITDPPSAESKLRQGITTYLSGEGGSAAPQSAETQDTPEVTADGDSVTWRTYEEYFAILEREGIPLNVIHDVGATQVRRIVLGEEDVEPTPDQMEEMKELVREAMEDGAVGLSTSLIYPPAVYASTEELVELASVAGEHGGAYFTHMRNESFAVLEAIREALTIGERAGVPVHIYHLKAAGEENWPLMDRALALIDSARATGMDVTADIYPYLRNGIGLGSFIHPRHYRQGDDALRSRLSDADFRAELREEIETTADWENWYRWVGSDWDDVLLVRVPEEMPSELSGMSLAEAAEHLGEDPWRMFFRLVQAGRTYVNPLSMNEAQKHAALRRPWVMIDTDASPVNPETAQAAHPRAFGAFPRVIAKYVRQDSVIRLEEAVRRMTSLAANRLGLHERGRVTPGMLADLVLFDPERLTDRATFQEPMRYAEGIDFMWVNGVVTIDDGELTGASGGRALRRGAGR